MEPTMTSLRVLSTVAAIALLLPMVAPTASFAQNPNGSKANSARAGSVHPGGGVRPGGGGGYHGGYHRSGGGGAVIGGAIAGAVIGGAIASEAYPGPGYYPPGPGYYDDSVAAGPPPGHDDGVASCMQTYRPYDPTYRSYDLPSGTYLGNDGQRHPCP
jgi:BA14K-like protein